LLSRDFERISARIIAERQTFQDYHQALVPRPDSWPHIGVYASTLREESYLCADLKSGDPDSPHGRAASLISRFARQDSPREFTFWFRTMTLGLEKPYRMIPFRTVPANGSMVYFPGASSSTGASVFPIEGDGSCISASFTLEALTRSLAKNVCDALRQHMIPFPYSNCIGD